MEETLSKILTELQQMNKRINSLEENQNQRFKGIDERFDAVDQRFKGIDERFDAVDQRFKGIDERFDIVDQRFKGIDERFDIVDERLETIEIDVKTLKDNLINGLEPYVEKIITHIDERTDDLKGTIEGQQLVIETLSARSIKHESEIKDFKRLLKHQ
ncbi:hypothetical protein BKP37_08985 [Anaerobacillus alkalilacustris]|uniref:t-SNARE coiled-coil homology domain-containing protein n=1 Tax=Anaerobacillus alkalilacustris TaxID=393763 RepID=A0A1S2LNY3_9BACI|nr:hypothetical protein [Anaerobacillus alkalilacustris]OIJ14208.1 hypothetical protein BKP37_08985 [Anaerobacillus alkalilacustris]